MADRNVDAARLEWDVFVTPAPLIVMQDKPPGAHRTYFQAMASTLIYGASDAVLVDVCLTAAQATALADWIAARERKLTTVYITHGHGDHWYGLAALLERFPAARPVATAGCVNRMRQQSSAAALAHWNQSFPGQIPERLVMAEELDGNVIQLEGQELVAVELGHTDTDATTCLHVPSIGLVVAGDAVYNDVHLFLAESTPQTRREWLAALDKIESLAPRAVVAAHKRPNRANDPGIVEETRQYIRDFDRLADSAATAQELYYAMLALYPTRINPQWALWSSVRAVMKSQPARVLEPARSFPI